MGKVSFKSDNSLVKQKVRETLEGTVIHQRQRKLALGRWDFVVFGPGKEKDSAVLRVCFAEQMMIQSASMYVASIGDPDAVGYGGVMKIEDLAGEEIDEKLKGLEVYHVSPLRPIKVCSKQSGADLSRMRDMALADFSEQNIAIVETPDESAWVISALRYLDECDEHFPDRVISSIRSSMRNRSLGFGNRNTDSSH